MVEQRTNYIVSVEVRVREMRPVEGWGFYPAYVAIPANPAMRVAQFDTVSEASAYMAIDGAVRYEIPTGIQLDMCGGEVETGKGLVQLHALDPVAYERLVAAFYLRSPAVKVRDGIARDAS